MAEREEGIRTGDAEEFACLFSAACRRAARLAEHEVQRSLLPVEACDAGDQVVVTVEDQEVVDRLDLARVLMPAECVHAEDRAAVGRVCGVEEVDDPGVILGHVLEVCLGFADGAVNGGLETRIERERLRKAAVLRGHDAATRIERDEVVLAPACCRSGE